MGDQRTELLLGGEAMERIARQRVILFGVGGVGSWCAESLVRSGVRRLTIVDSDCVAVSNINRQLMATTETVGRPKVEVLRQRLLTINPSAEISARQEVFSQDTVESFFPEGRDCPYDYIIDAIDSLRDKALLMLTACRTPATFFSSMGAALRLDPTHIRVTEFQKVSGDPLARALRKKFKSLGQWPERKFLCVYSDEPPMTNLGQPPAEEEPSMFNKPQTNGSLVHITAIFGFTLAGLVVRRIMTVLLSLFIIHSSFAQCPQSFSLRKQHDSLYWLNDWRLPYPVYQYQEGDVDGDGRVDAMVGVVKPTRFYPERGRRLFVFKQLDSGKVRPMWLGSKLGGILCDFRFMEGGTVRSLEMTTDSLYVVADYRWSGFGMAFERFIIKGTDEETAIKYFRQ